MHVNHHAPRAFRKSSGICESISNVARREAGIDFVEKHAHGGSWMIDYSRLPVDNAARMSQTESYPRKSNDCR